MPKATLEKFGFPASLVKTYQHWHLLLRPAQPTLGSLILICKENVHQYSDISGAAAVEQALVVSHLETVLRKRFNYSKINYLMLMMVDPAVHFHVIPRYEHPVSFCDNDYPDSGWPGPPNLSGDLALDPACQQELLTTLNTDFSQLPEHQEQEKKYRRMYTSGCFDIFHHGHLNILRRSKELCDHLLVGVSTDELIEETKGQPPVVPFAERIEILEANIYVDEVIPQADKNKQTIVDLYNIDAISVGSDWKGKYPAVTCEMVYFDCTPDVSSTLLRPSHPENKPAEQ